MAQADVPTRNMVAHAANRDETLARGSFIRRTHQGQNRLLLSRYLLGCDGSFLLGVGRRHFRVFLRILLVLGFRIFVAHVFLLELDRRP